MSVYVSFVGVCVVCFSLSVYFFRHIIHTPVISFRFLRGGKMSMYRLYSWIYIIRHALTHQTLESPFEVRLPKKDSSWIAVYFYSCVALSTKPTTFQNNSSSIQMNEQILFESDTLFILENYLLFGHKVLLKNASNVNYRNR